MKKIVILFSLAMLVFSGTIYAQKTWTGATSTAWNLAGNWSPSGIPTSSDNVTIPSAPANQPLISGTTTPVCNNLTVNSGATLTITGTSGNHAILTVAGTATFNGALSIGGHFQGNQGKLVAGNIVWNSTSSIAAFFNARCEVSGNWTFASGSAIDMSWCWVTLTGTGSSTINSFSANSKFSSLTLGKSSTATTTIGATSTALTITGGLNINAGNTLNCAANITSIWQGNVVSNGYFKLYSGTVSLESTSGTQSIQMANTGNIFNSLKINCSGTVTINNSLTIQDNLTIQIGTLNPQNNTLYVAGDWINTAGPDFFTEGTGKVVMNVIINKNEKGAFDQFINYSENFNILEVNNAYGDLIINNASAVVTCNQYDWTAGGIKVQAGTFTALDLADNGIFGRFSLQTGGTINLTNNDGYVDLNGSTINISGGTFNVYGGTTDSYWPFSQNASLTMSGGIFNFAETGILVSASTTTLTSNITGGTIKTAKNFNNSRSDFIPTGGTIELYGPTDASLYCVGTTALYGVKINKTASKDGENTAIIYPRIDRETGEVITDETRAQIVNLTSPITFNGNFVLTSGTFNSNSNTIQAKRDWTNNAGAGSFVPGTGRVIFNGGNYHQYCYNETFNILEVAKASGGAFRLNSGTTVSCALYDWTAGSIDVLANGGTFTALDLHDNGIFGGYYVNSGGTINLYQDAFQYVDLNGIMTFTGGGTINVYGGNGNSQWALGANASITMNAGTLDFKDQGITLTTLSPNAFTENITGGTIRTTGGFFCNRADFTPVGGTLEFYGNSNVNLEQYAGSLRNIRINKSIGSTVSVSSNLSCVTIDVDEGRINTENKIINLNGHLNINEAGIFRIAGGAQLKIASEMSVNVNNGGYFYAIGAQGNECVITRQTSNYYYFNVNGGATISTRYTRYEYSANIIVAPGAIIDPAVPFDYCTFSHGQGTYILFNNNQELTIRGAHFPTLPPTNTVAKTINAGHINFKDATGAYAGAAYEYDPHNLIDWTITQPGLWTGAVSSNWYTGDNWDGGITPNAAINVVIPETAPNWPVLDVGEWECNNLTIYGTLFIGSANLTAYGDMEVNGTLETSSGLGQLTVYGDVNWNPGAVADEAIFNILVRGNWNFNEGSDVYVNARVYFEGDQNKWIRNYSENSKIRSIYVTKTGGAQIGFSDFSTHPLVIENDLKVFSDAKFVSDSFQDVILKGDLTSDGITQFNGAALKLVGASQSLFTNDDDYFNHLVFQHSDTVFIHTVGTDTFIINGDVWINSGVVDAFGTEIHVKSHWHNNAGAQSFLNNLGRVVFNGGNYHQYCFTNAAFNVIEIDKPLGGALRISENKDVTCNRYDWTAGALDVLTDATFTAGDLADDGIYGSYYVNAGSDLNLYQDSEQSVDLNGNLTFNNGGIINIYHDNGGIGDSFWAAGADASVTMNGGTLDFHESGIYIASAKNNLTLDITGGEIKTVRSFYCARPDFNPTGGTIALYGDQNANLSMNAGALFNLNINKAVSNSVDLSTNVTLNGGLNVNGGTLNLNAKTLATGNESAVNDGGVLHLNAGSALLIQGSWWLNVNSGGLLKAIGTSGNPALISRNGALHYINININSGGNISARNARFHYMVPLRITSGGIIDPDNPLSDCQFRYSGTGMLWVENSQTLLIRNIEFLAPAAGYNVYKSSNNGVLTFKDAFGNYSGAAYENDPYNRIDWTVTQPGLWTGAVSSNWYTGDNWDDGIVPNAGTNVTIPATAPYMPEIDAGDWYINSLTVNGSLKLSGGNLTVYNATNFNGQLLATSPGSQLVVLGDISWNTGSSATIDHDITLVCNGNWNFNAGSSVQLNNGKVIFTGTTSKWIRSYSENSHFHHLYIQKTGGAQVGFSDLSTQKIEISGDLKIWPLALFAADADKDMILQGNFTCNGTFEGNAGKLVFNGVNQTITPNTDDYFNNVRFNQSGTVTVNTAHTSNLVINKNLQISSGVFAPGNVTIYLAGDWSNPAGLDAFNESNSTVVFNGTSTVQRIYNDENYMTLVIEKAGSGSVLELSSMSDIFCYYYNWNNGGLSVVNGSFTAHSLVGGVIGGDVSVQTNGTITMGNLSEQIDLVGRLFILGGTFNIINGIESQWPGEGHAQLTMTGGELNVYPYGIEIVNSAEYLFINQITGGKIRTTGSFINHRADFNPTAGTIELYGAENAFLSMNTPAMASLHNVIIDKQAAESKGGAVTLSGNILINGSLNVNEGTFNCSTGYMLVVLDEVNVNDGGILSFEPYSAFGLYPGCQVSINQGGTFKSLGTESQPIVVDRWGSTGFYDFGVGGTISSRFTTFNNCGNLIVAPTGFIDPDNAFYHCTFPYAIGALLVINNSQEITIRGVNFPNIPITLNVKKLNDAGRVNMKDATGPGAGPAYEYDPYNRINWEESQPGLWTGLVSTDWHTAGNWDDLNIPSSFTVVQIPESVASGRMPVINQNAVCHGINVAGTLMINTGELMVNYLMTVIGSVTINDHLTVKGNLTWLAGSMVSVASGSVIKCSGDFITAYGSTVQLDNGVILFEGSGNSSLILNAANAYLNQVQINKESGAWLLFDASSSKPLTINENLSVSENSGFKSQSSQTINLNKHLIILGAWQCDAGAVVLGGVSPIVTMSPGNYFNDLKINTSYGGVTFTEVFSNEVTIKNDLFILSGGFSGSDQIFRIGRDWHNNSGASAFIAQNSKVIFNGTDPAQGQFIYGSTHFNILELQQHAGSYLRINDGSLVVVNQYDWTSGTLEVEAGHFLVYDLMDNRLAGNWKLHQNGQISLSDENAIGLGGNITIFGGTFSLSGGTNYYSYWPFGGNASLTMSGGVLDFNNQSVFIHQDQNFTFTSNITGGLIRTYGWFLAENPGFNPAGGTVELYGETPGYVSSANGGNFYKLRINKSSISPDIGMNNAVVKNSMTIDGGRCIIANSYSLTCQGTLNLNSGWLEMYPGGELKMGNQSLVNVWSGAELRSYGTPELKCFLTGSSPLSYYGIYVAAGGYISMINTIYEQLDETGLFVVSDALVDEANAFNGCVFRNGKPVVYPLLTINNSQDLQLMNVEFSGQSRGKNAAKFTDQGSLTFVDATGNLAGSAFETDPYGRIFWQDDQQIHSIELPAGWSGISSYLIPSQPWMQEVFAPISDELIIAQTMDGMYYPEQFINTIGTWTSHSAYKIKTTQACVLPINGNLETDMTVSLNAGWNLLPVVTPDGADPADLFMPVNGFVIAKDVAGTGVFWPQYNITTIGTLYPGKAYYVMMTAPGVVDYTGMKGSQNLTGFKNLSGLEIQPTPSTHTIAILPEALKGFEQGTIIAAYDQAGNCFGATVYNSETISMTVFGDDPTTAEKDGFLDGEMILFKNLSGLRDLTGLVPTFDPQLPQSDGLFSENGLSAITGFVSSTGVGFTDFGRLVNIFPNPSDGVVNITGLPSGAEIIVTDVRGQVVLVAETFTASKTSVDLTDSNAGVYLIKIEMNGQNIFRKIVLR